MLSFVTYDNYGSMQSLVMPLHVYKDHYFCGSNRELFPLENLVARLVVNFLGETWFTAVPSGVLNNKSKQGDAPPKGGNKGKGSRKGRILEDLMP